MMAIGHGREANMSILADRLKVLREQSGMSQEELGQQIGKDQKQVWRYENGVSIPTADVLLLLAQVFTTTADYLLGMTDNPERPLRNSHDLTDTEKEIIHVLRSKPPEWERKFLDFIRIG
jgi:transcriptional regulator with XRE-family HTH domain